MKADRLSHFAFPFQYRQPLFHPFIKIDDRLSAFQRLVHRVECSPFRYKIPIGYDCIRFTHHVFIPAKVAALVVILGNHDHPVHPFQQTGIQQLVFRFKPQGLFPKRYCRYELDIFVSLPDLQDRLRSSHINQIRWPSRCSIPCIPARTVLLPLRSQLPDLCKYPGIVSGPLQNTFLTVSRESHCLIVSCFHVIFCFLFLHISIQTERYFIS